MSKGSKDTCVSYVQVELQETRHNHLQEGTVSLVVKDNKER